MPDFPLQQSLGDKFTRTDDSLDNGQAHPADRHFAHQLIHLADRPPENARLSESGLEHLGQNESPFAGSDLEDRNRPDGRFEGGDLEDRNRPDGRFEDGDLEDDEASYDETDYDGDADDDGFGDYLDDPPSRGRSGRSSVSRPRLVVEGRSGRTSIDTDGSDPDTGRIATQPFSSYDVATHGPSPAPDWLITALTARDSPLGMIKTGKEADVTLLDRSVEGGPGCLLAVKTYRTSEHRMFHRDSSYTEGRRTRRSRESRAMANRTRFGRELLAGKWADAEFTILSQLWSAGANVPYPVQILGTELMMEFVGDPDGTAAPRLANFEGSPAEFVELWHDLIGTLDILADLGLTHGDLSAYNVLVRDDRCVLIDLPQAVDVVANPQGPAFLERDCQVIAEFFARRGVQAADGELLALRLAGIARGH